MGLGLGSQAGPQTRPVYAPALQQRPLKTFACNTLVSNLIC